MITLRNVLIFVLIVSSSISQELEGNTCNREDNTIGICAKVQDCPSVFQSRKRPKLCGYYGFDLIVCCEGPQQSYEPPIQQGYQPPFQPQYKPQAESPYQPEPAVITSKPPQRQPELVTTLSPIRQPQSGQPGAISKQKCLEYSKLVFQKREFDDYDNVEGTGDLDTCALVEGIPLVINGKSANPREFPHQANIGYRYGSKTHFLCTGSLISENFVLSAAHCSYIPSYVGPVTAVIGDLDQTSNKDDADPISYRIIEVKNHPLYERTSRYHDIALYKLATNVAFNAFRRPACLNTDNQLTVTKFIASGWGRTENGPSSKLLQKVALTVVPVDQCNKYFRAGNTLKDGIVDDLMICAGDLRGTNDTCNGDSGGPLQFRLSEPYCMYSIAGVTAFGKQTCGGGSPAVYTRVSNYIPWIEKVVWGSNN